MEVEVPQIAVTCVQLDPENIIMSLEITTSGTKAEYFLCEVGQNYQNIAKQIHDKICEAGNQARRAKSGIIAVSGLPDSLKNGRR